MPTSPFMPVNPPARKAMVADTSDYTRYLRMSATLAPYINKGTSPVPNALGWRSQQANLDARLIAPVFGTHRAFIPNAK